MSVMHLQDKINTNSNPWKKARLRMASMGVSMIIPAETIMKIRNLLCIKIKNSQVASIMMTKMEMK